MPATSEFSAGGVVVRDRSCVVIVPKRRTADGSRVLALPKGHPAPGETPEAAALREVREEAGVRASLVEKLGDVRYFYQRGGRVIAKLVSFYLLAYEGGEPTEHDHEVENARWMDLAEAANALTYRGEREMAARALRRLDR
jgi:8-oxo-dGTP pyrophosphatase MutT (NUDIX family)